MGVGRCRRPHTGSAPAGCAHVVHPGAAARAAGAAGGPRAEPVGGASVLALVEVSLHVPAAAERLAAGRTPVCAPVDVAVMLQRPGVSETFATLITAVTARCIGLHVEGFRDAI